MNIRKLSLIVLALSANAWAQDDGLKIFISADMEGVVGAVTAEQLRPGGFEYERFRGFMTAEVNAAIAGHFGVPVIMVSGDDVAVAENQAVIGVSRVRLSNGRWAFTRRNR